VSYHDGDSVAQALFDLFPNVGLDTQKANLEKWDEAFCKSKGPYIDLQMLGWNGAIRYTMSTTLNFVIYEFLVFEFSHMLTKNDQ